MHLLKWHLPERNNYNHIMKKFYFIILAAAAIVSAASCQKISDLITGKTTTEEGLVDDKGKDLTPDQQKAKIEETANALMDLLDKEGWEAEYNKVNSTVESLGTVEVDSEEIGTYLQDIVNAWTSMQGEDPQSVAVTVAHLTDIKGHFTQNAEGKFDFSEADDLAITVFDGTSPVTVTFQAKDESKTPAHFADENDDVTIFIPGTSLLSISKDNEVMGSLELRLKPMDANGDGIITEEDMINVSYSLKVGAYVFELSQADYATTNASVKAKILKGKQLIIGASVTANYQYQETETGIDFQSASANAMIDLAGKMQLRFVVPDAIKLEEVSDKITEAEANNNQEAFKAALEEIEKLYGIGVYYDGKNTLQATIGFEPTFEEADGYSYFDAIPVIRFADGTSYAAEEYFTQERFGDLAKDIQEWLADLMNYLGLAEEDPTQA